MVLFTDGDAKYFDPRLLEYLMYKNNDKVIDILQSYQKNQSLPEMSQLRDNSESTLLHYAAKSGNADIVKYLLETKCEIDAQDNSGRTPLMLAVQLQREAAFELLLKANADIHLTNFEGKSALTMVCEFKFSLRMLAKLFECTTWQRIIDGITPDELAKKLEEAGFTIKTALLWGHEESMRLLLSREKSIDTPKYSGGRTMLHNAVQLKKVKIVKVLIECGANVDVLDDSKATPIYYLYDGVNDHRTNESAEILEILEMLVSRASLLTASNAMKFFRGFMQIHNALQYGSDDAIKIILRSNVDLNTRDERGNTALHYLARNCEVNLFKLMRGRKFDANVRNNDGNTPLFMAVEWDSFEAMRFFLENGADPNVVNNAGEVPLYRALTRRRTSAKRSVEILLRYGADLQKYVQGVTTFHVIFRGDENCFDKAEPLLAHLAIIVEFGTKITHLTWVIINLQRSWLEYFDKCRRQVKIMKNTTVYNRVQLFEFLTGDEKKVVIYVRNEELVSELGKVIEEFGDDESPYRDLLRSRLARAIQLAELKEKAIAAIGRILGSKNNTHCFVAKYIVDFLSFRDMENLHSVWYPDE